MSLAVDPALLVDFVAAGRDDLGFEREIAAGHADTIELQLQISLAPEVAGIFRRFEMANQIASARESLLTELGLRAKVAEDGVPDVDGGRGEVGFIQSALQKSAGGQDDLARAGAQSQCDDDET